MEDVTIIEKQFAEKTAAEYRSRGYEVFRDAPLDFLPGFSADLLVRKDGESKVIEVRTRTSMARPPGISEVAEALSSMPSWSFDLLLVGEPEQLDAPEDSTPLSDRDIMERIQNAELAFDSGFFQAAFLLAWSACEAVLRQLLSTGGFEIRRVTASNYVLGHAVYQGILSGHDEDVLSEMLEYRNAIVHGFAVNDFGAEKVRELITAVKQLQRSSTSGTSYHQDSL